MSTHGLFATAITMPPGKSFPRSWRRNCPCLSTIILEESFQILARGFEHIYILELQLLNFQGARSCLEPTITYTPSSI